MSGESGLMMDDTSTAQNKSCCEQIRDGAMRVGLSKPLDKHRELTQEQVQLVLGTLMGDGSMYKKTSKAKTKTNALGRVLGTHPRYYTTHGKIQEEYCRHKADVLSNYVNTPPKIRENQGWGIESCVFTTLTSSAFDWVYDLVFQKDKKVVTQRWLDFLTIEGIAWWFMDDGSGTTRSTTLSTHGFSHAENELISKWLTGLGYKTTIDKIHRRGRTLFSLRLNVDAAYKLQESMRPYIHRSMLYKLKVQNPEVQASCARCGDTLKLHRRQLSNENFCSDCLKLNRRNSLDKYYKTHKDEITKRQAEYRKEHQELCSQRSMASRRKNAERYREYKRSWRKEKKNDPDFKTKKAADDKRHREKMKQNPEKMAAAAAKRQAARTRRMQDPEYREKTHLQQIARRAKRTPEQIEKDRTENRDRMRRSSITQE